jgi:hypothetical protein
VGLAEEQHGHGRRSNSGAAEVLAVGPRRGEGREGGRGPREAKPGRKKRPAAHAMEAAGEDPLRRGHAGFNGGMYVVYK